MRKILTTLAFATIIALTSCNNPLNKKYSDKTFEQDAKEIGDSKKLSPNEAEMLAGYIMLSKLGGKDIEGKTPTWRKPNSQDLCVSQFVPACFGKRTLYLGI